MEILGGNWKGKGLEFVTTVCLVDILTTEGINFSDRSANELGAFCEFELADAPKIKTNIIESIFNFFILSLCVIDNNKSNNCKN